MLQYEKPTTGIWPLLRFGDVLYHSIVRVVRQKSSNALLGLIGNMSQSVVMIGVFFMMFTVFGMRGGYEGHNH